MFLEFRECESKKNAKKQDIGFHRHPIFFISLLFCNLPSVPLLPMKILPSFSNPPSDHMRPDLGNDIFLNWNFHESHRFLIQNYLYYLPDYFHQLHNLCLFRAEHCKQIHYKKYLLHLSLIHI